VLAGNGAYDAAKQSELDDFANSRGAGERKRTDDGLRIFSPAELGMNDKGGDTELCPFDCNCCKFPKFPRHNTRPEVNYCSKLSVEPRSHTQILGQNQQW
jgi:hypothetical protein